MSAIKIQTSDNHFLIKCKSCLNPTSISASKCQTCGDIDPFGYKTIQELGEKKDKKTSLFFFISVALSLLIGYNTIWWIGLILLFVLAGISKFVIDEYFSEYRSYYYTIRDKVKSSNTFENFDIWDKYAKEMLKNHD